MPLSTQSEGAASPPVSKTWKYLENPAAPEWLRSRPEVAFPNLGDFAVLSIDPVASVGHLDAIAKRSAALLPIRRYVVLVFSVRIGLHTSEKHLR